MKTIKTFKHDCTVVCGAPRQSKHMNVLDVVLYLIIFHTLQIQSIIKLYYTNSDWIKR